VDIEEGSEDQKYLGFQFTILDKNKPDAAERLEKKRNQINRTKTQFSEDLDVDDILLVTVPSDIYGLAFRKWEKAGKPPGGPDSLWTKEVRELVLRYTLVNFLTEKEMDTYVSQLLEARRVSDSEYPSDRKDSAKRFVPKPFQEQKIPEKKLSLVGSRRFSVAPQLAVALSSMQKRASGKRDMQFKLQESIDSVEKRKAQPDYKGIKANELFDRLNSVLSEVGLREIDPAQLDSIPAELASFLSKAASFKEPNARRSFMINKLFPSRSS
jgi:hypothetical protein